jgi:diaminopimelate decarboxylase
MQFTENIFPQSATVDDNGELKIDGIEIAAIAESYGTPVMIYSSKDIVKATKKFVEVFDRVFYASKAAPIISIEKLIFGQGAGCDVSTKGELEVALRAGCDPKKIIFHGNNKSNEDIKAALESGVLRIVIDSLDECDRVEKVAKELEIIAVEVQARITVGIEAHTHEAIMTGGNDGKFGNPLITGDAKKVCERIISSDILHLKGLHCHIGSQIFETKHLAEAGKILAQFLVELNGANKQDGSEKFEVTELNVGGGFGIKYEENDDPPAPIEMAKAVRSSVDSVLQASGLNKIEVWSEPGRALVGTAGITIYEVGTVKVIEGLQTYVGVDGGMSDNARPATYDAVHAVWVNGRGNNLSSDQTQHVAIAGKHCEQGDILNKDTVVSKEVSVGDLLVMASTGAYSFAMSSNYNMLTRPPVVLVDSSASEPIREIVRRETIDEVLSRQV